MSWHHLARPHRWLLRQLARRSKCCTCGLDVASTIQACPAIFGLLRVTKHSAGEGIAWLCFIIQTDTGKCAPNIEIMYSELF